MAEGEVSSIGVKLTLDAEGFIGGMSEAQESLNSFQRQADQAGAGAGMMRAGGGRQVATGVSRSQNLGNVNVSLSVNRSALTALRKEIQAGLGPIPVTITPQFASSGRFSLTNVFGSMLSLQYGMSQQQARQAATSGIERALGSLPKKATGGPVQANRPIIVGERRPEVFVPKTPGLIEPSVKDFYRKQEQVRRIEYETAIMESTRQRQHEQRMAVASRGRYVYRSPRRQQAWNVTRAHGNIRNWEHAMWRDEEARYLEERRREAAHEEAMAEELWNLRANANYWHRFRRGRARMAGGPVRGRVNQALEPYAPGSPAGGMWDVEPPAGSGYEGLRIFGPKSGGRLLHVRHEADGSMERMSLSRVMEHLQRHYGIEPEDLQATGLWRKKRAQGGVARRGGLPRGYTMEFWGRTGRPGQFGSNIPAAEWSPEADRTAGWGSLPVYRPAEGPIGPATYSGAPSNFARLQHPTVRQGWPGGFTAVVRDRQGNIVGLAPFDTSQIGKRAYATPRATWVEEGHRGRGLANAMYVRAEKWSGATIQPDWTQSDQGRALWQQPNRPFGRGVAWPRGSDLPATKPIVTRDAQGRDVLHLDVGPGARWVSAPLGHARQGLFRAAKPDDFFAAISSASKVVRPSGRRVGETVHVYSPEEYSAMRTYLTKDRLAGYAIKDPADLVSVFNVGGPGMGKAAVRSAIQRGAMTLDAFDELGGAMNLPSFYRRFGFRETGRDPWNPEYAPEGWTGGTPDVVYMARRIQKLMKRGLGGPVGRRRSPPWLNRVARTITPQVIRPVQAYGHQLLPRDLNYVIRSHDALSQLAADNPTGLPQFGGRIWYAGRRRALLEEARSQGLLDFSSMSSLMRTSRHAIDIPSVASPGLPDIYVPSWATEIMRAAQDPAIVRGILNGTIEPQNVIKALQARTKLPPGKSYRDLTQALRVGAGAADAAALLRRAAKVGPFRRVTRGAHELVMDSHQIEGGGALWGSMGRQRSGKPYLGSLHPDMPYKLDPRTGKMIPAEPTLEDRMGTLNIGGPTYERAVAMEASQRVYQTFRDVWPQIEQWQAGEWIEHFPRGRAPSPYEAALARIWVPRREMRNIPRGWSGPLLTPPGGWWGSGNRPKAVPYRQFGGFVQMMREMEPIMGYQMAQEREQQRRSRHGGGEVQFDLEGMRKDLRPRVEDTFGELLLKYPKVGGTHPKLGSSALLRVGLGPWLPPWAAYEHEHPGVADIRFSSSTVHPAYAPWGGSGRPGYDRRGRMIGPGARWGAVNTIEGVATHEFGHALEQYVRLQTSALGRRSPNAHWDTLMDTLGNTNVADILSKYAEHGRTDPFNRLWLGNRASAEPWAELFSIIERGTPLRKGRVPHGVYGQALRILDLTSKYKRQRGGPVDFARVIGEGRISAEQATSFLKGSHKYEHMFVTAPGEKGPWIYATSREPGRVSLNQEVLDAKGGLSIGLLKDALLDMTIAHNHPLSPKIVGSGLEWASHLPSPQDIISSLVHGASESRIYSTTGETRLRMPDPWKYRSREEWDVISENILRMMGKESYRYGSASRILDSLLGGPGFTRGVGYTTKTGLFIPDIQWLMSRGGTPGEYVRDVFQHPLSYYGVGLQSLERTGKRARGGPSSLEGLYIVNEIGKELFVPKRLAHMIPPKVMSQIPKAKDGAFVINQPPNSLFAPPEDGIIVPNRLMNQVPHAQEGAGGEEREEFMVMRRGAGGRWTGGYGMGTAAGGAGPIPVIVQNVEAFETAFRAAIPTGTPGETRVGQLNWEHLTPEQQAMLRAQHPGEGGAPPPAEAGGGPGTGTGGGRARAIRYGPSGLPVIEMIPGAAPGPRSAYTPGAGGGLPEDRAAEFAQARQQLSFAAQSQAARTPRGMAAVLGAQFLGGRGINLEAIAAQRRALTNLERAETAVYESVSGPDFAAYKERLDDLVLARHDERREIENDIQSREAAQPKLREWNEANKEYQKSLQKGLPGLASTARNFGAIMVGVQAYSIAMQGVSMAMAAATPATEKWVDSLFGYQGLATKTTSAIGEMVHQTHGNIDAVMAQTAANAGLSGSMMEYVKSAVSATAMAKAAGKAQGETVDLYRTAVSMAGGGAPEGLYTGYGGVLGSAFLGEFMGGGKGFMEQVAGGAGRVGQGQAGNINLATQFLTNDTFRNFIFSNARGTPGLGRGMAKVGDFLGGVGDFARNLSPISPFVGPLAAIAGMFPQTPKAAPGQAQIFAGRSQVEQTGLREYFDDLTKSMARGADAAGKLTHAQYAFTDSIEEINKATMAALAAGDTYGAELAMQGVVLRDSAGAVIDNSKAYQSAVEDMARGKTIIEPEVWAAQNKRQLLAQQQALAMQTQRRIGIETPFGVARQLWQQPLIAPGAAFFPGAVAGKPSPLAAGLSAGVAGAAKGLLTETGSLNDELRILSEEGMTKAREEVKKFLTPQDLSTWDKAIESANTLSGQIASVTTEMSRLNQEASTASWNNQIRLAKRALGDALGMLGKVGGTRLGQLQREQWLIGRQSQELSLKLQQRQITTQMALAQFQAPGETGEERYYRQRQAIAEAGIAKTQLGFSWKEFTISGELWKENVERAKTDAEKSLAVMNKARDAEGYAIAAQENIAKKQMKLGVTLDTIDALFGQASGNWSTALSAATTGIGEFSGALQDGIDAIYESLGYTGKTNPRTGATTYTKPGETTITVPGFSVPSKPRGTPTVNPFTGRVTGATGLLGTFSQPTQMLVGEAGTETVAVLRNPRTATISTGSSGSMATIQINVNGPVVRSEADISTLARAVAYEVERNLSRKGQMFGLRGPAV